MNDSASACAAGIVPGKDAHPVITEMEWRRI